MKKKILLLYNHKELDRNILEPVQYVRLEQEWKVQGGGNSGNKLFISAVEQYVCQRNVEYGYLDNETPNVLNEQYDLAVLPLANILNANKTVINQLEWYTNLIKQLNMPVYIIGIGLQAGSYDEIEELAKRIKVPVSEFIKAVYAKGGELALRGFATKELLDKIICNSAVVTGCPSMYQMGPDLRVTTSKVSREEFCFAINGNLSYLQKIGMLQSFEKYPQSVYLDQDEFAEILYFQNLYNGKIDILQMLRLIGSKTYMGLKLLCDDRVKLIYDIPVWLDYLKQFNYSCGSRIHGNIAAILAGVPATVIVRDARTREIAEFYDIPTVAGGKQNKDLYELYRDADYNKFNQTYNEKYSNFENFMRDHGIVDTIEDRDLFLEKRNADHWQMPEINQQNKVLINNLMEKRSRWAFLLDKAFELERMFRK